MIKHFLFFLFGILLLPACIKETRTPLKDEPAEVEQPAEAQPTTESSQLDEELLYILLAAEIAGQRGDFGKALDGYIDAAVRTQDPKIAERATQIALFLRDSEKAMQAVSIWIESSPNNLAARKAAILVYLSRGDQESALQHIRYWLDNKGAPFPRKMENLVKILDKGPATRLGIMDQLTDRYGSDPDFLYAFALLAFNKNEPDTALGKVNQALELRTDWDKAISLKARIVAMRGSDDKAGEELRELVEEYPDNADLAFVYGQYLIKTEDFEAARVQFEKVLGVDPKHYEAMFGLAGLNLQLNDLDRAKELFLNLKDVQAWKGQSYLFLGRIENSQGNYEEALDWFDRVPKGPLASEAKMNALLVLAKLGRFDEADARIVELYRRFPDQSVRIHLVRVELLTKQKKYQKAFAILNAALKEQPRQPELLYSRALVAERLDRLDVLEADLRILLDNDPDDVNALNALGYTLVDKTSRLQEARQYLEKAIRLKPADPVIIDSYGWLEFKLGNYEKALRYLRRAFDEHPDPEIAAHLGEVLWVSGRTSEAKDVWRKALADDPESDYLLNVKNRFPDAFSD